MILLDTHAWIWLTDDPDRLGREARRALRGRQLRGLAAVSCWELAALAARGRIEFDRDIVATALTHGATLVTRDERIRASGLVKTLW